MRFGSAGGEAVVALGEVRRVRLGSAGGGTRGFVGRGARFVTRCVRDEVVGLTGVQFSLFWRAGGLLIWADLM